MEKPIKMDDLGVTIFLETPKSSSISVFCVSCFLAGYSCKNVRKLTGIAFERFWYGIVLLVLYRNHLRGGSVPLYSWR